MNKLSERLERKCTLLESEAKNLILTLVALIPLKDQLKVSNLLKDFYDKYPDYDNEYDSNDNVISSTLFNPW